MEIVTLNEAPEMSSALKELNDSTWPEFLLRADVRNWSSIYEEFHNFQVLVLDGHTLVAAGLSVPFEWTPGCSLPSTIDEIVYPARWPLEAEGVLCALGVLVRPKYRRRGLSRAILTEIRGLSEVHGLQGVLVPVRPNRKHEYPDESIETYADRRDENGCLLDPWLRVHEELGGDRLGFLQASVTVTASIREWENWTGMQFPTSGSYSIPEGLVPLVIDFEKDQGTYQEPNVWYFHQKNPQH